ncbi:MAG: hypothetical protein KAI24_21110, partial [Planctomycetes bacterium]|nr:hypothetical protein [Planctomycetota bacterium]
EIVEGPRAAAGDDEATFEDMQLLDAADGAEAGGPGWEPLPSTSMNELSEVDEVQRTDEVEYDTSGYEEDETYEDAEGEEYDDGSDEGYGPEDLEDVDGHDIYAEDDEHDAVVVGAMPPRRRAVSLLLSLAASLMVVGLCATVVVRPEWFGLEVEPEQVARVEVPRPRIAVDVPEPPQLGEQVVSVEGVGQPIEGQPTEGQPTEGPSTVGQATEGQPTESQPTEGPSTGGQPGEGDPAVAAGGGTESPTQPEGQPAEGQPTAGTPAEGQPQLVNNQQTEIPTPGEAPSTAATDPDGLAQGSTVADPATEGATGTDPATVVVEAPEPAAPNAWPVAETTKQPEVEAEGQQLARFGDDLLVGGLGQGSTASANALDGVMPGSRAFAQLHNGNYFIGRVKQVAAETITLRVETGEVTLPTGEIAQLTRLGSSDYEELQKATKGFVRLTNNNRLVGGILSRIADDHVVLEFRSNRVMLPKSAVGEIVSGEGDGRVRLDTTTEEDNWLRKVAERELGTGRGAESQPKPQVPAGSSRSGPPK